MTTYDTRFFSDWKDLPADFDPYEGGVEPYYVCIRRRSVKERLKAMPFHAYVLYGFDERNNTEMWSVPFVTMKAAQDAAFALGLDREALCRIRKAPA